MCEECARDGSNSQCCKTCTYFVIFLYTMYCRTITGQMLGIVGEQERTQWHSMLGNVACLCVGCKVVLSHTSMRTHWLLFPEM